MLIFKICPPAEWAEAERQGVYFGSAKDREDGFLHFSTFEQLQGTLERHFPGTEDLMLVAVDDAVLGDAVKFELSRDGALFPHLYGSLPLGAVTWARKLVRKSGAPAGIF